MGVVYILLWGNNMAVDNSHAGDSHPAAQWVDAYLQYMHVGQMLVKLQHKACCCLKPEAHKYTYR